MTPMGTWIVGRKFRANVEARNPALTLIKRIHLPRESVEREQRDVVSLGREGEKGSCAEYLRH